MALTKADVKEAVTEALADHSHCWIAPEDQGLVKDLVKAARMFKNTVIYGVVIFLAVGTAAAVVLAAKLGGSP